MPRDMQPDELERFEEDVVQGSSADRPVRIDVNPGTQSEIGRETGNDKDEDGLPDEPAKYRVPS